MAQCGQNYIGVYKMKFLINLFFIFIFSQEVFAQVSNGRTSDATNFPGSSSMKNYVKNPDCAKNVLGITASGGSLTRGTTTPLNEDTGTECVIDASASGQTYTWALNTFGQGMKGQNCEARLIYEGDASLYKAYINNGSTKITTDLQLENASSASKTVSINFPCGDLSAANSFVVEATDNAAAAFSNAKVYVGIATNLSNVAQAQLYGTVTVTACSAAWTTTSTSFANFSAGTSCSYAVTGNASAPSTNIPAIKFSSLPPGDYLIKAEGTFEQQVAGKYSQIRFNDGINSTRETSTFGNASAAWSGVTGSISYTTAQSNITIQIQGNTTSAGTTGVFGTTVNPLTITVWRFPSSSELALNIRNPAAPTIQKFTSGSGTYTRPNGVKYIRVRMVGGGGGGGPGGTAAGTAGTDGGNSTFGSSLLTANGGGGGAWVGTGAPGGGGTVTVNSPAISVVALAGAAGGSSGYTGTGNAQTPGGVGGSSPFGGAGNNNNGVNAVANSGSGGGGAANNTATSANGGGGGGAGGYIEAIIISPSATYSYAVGAGGNAGSGATGTTPGAGGSGVIIIEEYYDSGNAPLLVGSVTSNSSGLERVERALVTPTSGATCTVNKQSGSWITATTPTAAGDCTLTITGFSDTPSCTVTAIDNTAINQVGAVTRIGSVSSTSLRIQVAGLDETVAWGAGQFNGQPWQLSVICMGPR